MKQQDYLCGNIGADRVRFLFNIGFNCNILTAWYSSWVHMKQKIFNNLLTNFLYYKVKNQYFILIKRFFPLSRFYACQLPLVTWIWLPMSSRKMSTFQSISWCPFSRSTGKMSVRYTWSLQWDHPRDCISLT